MIVARPALSSMSPSPSEEFAGDHAASGIGLCTVTSFVPSGNVASTWISGIISGTPSITSRARQQRRAVAHQLGDRAAVARAFHDRRAMYATASG